MRFNRKQFFDGYRRLFGAMTQQQVVGLERLLGNMESDAHIPDNLTGLYWAAYILATVKRETAHTFTPIHEYGGKQYFISRYGGHTRKGRELGNDTPEEGYDYAGKGDVQTTGEANYEKAEIALRYEYPELVADFERRTGKTFDLTVGDQAGDKSDPQNILDPAISYAVMSYGMRTGMFTGRRLGQYTAGKEPNYLGMRAIVNGNDHDDEIAADARKFEKILKASLEDDEINSIVDRLGKSSADVPAVSPTPDPAEPPAVEIPQTGLESPGIQPPAEQPPTIPASVNAVIEQKPEGWLKRKWKQITVFVSGNSLLDGWSERFAQVQALGLPSRFWTNLIYFTVGGAAIYLLFDWYQDYQERKLTGKLIDANSTPTNLVQMASQSHVDSYEADPNWQVIKRR